MKVETKNDNEMELYAMSIYENLIQRFKKLDVKVVASQKTIHPFVKQLLAENVKCVWSLMY